MATSPEKMDELLKQYSLTEEDCNCVITDVHVDEISRTLLEDWRSLCSQVEMPKISRSDIEREKTKEKERRQAFLSEWKTMSGSEVTYKKLISLLLDINCREDAEGVCKLLKKSLPEKGHPPPNSGTEDRAKPIPAVMDLDPVTRRDLEFQLDFNRDKILEKFASFTVSLCKAVIDTGVSFKDFQLLLLGLSALGSSHDGKAPILLDNVKADIKKAESFHDIFNVLTADCCSFINDGIFQSIIREYNIDTSSDEKLQYTEHLMSYLRGHTIDHFVSINPKLKELPRGSEELTLKFDSGLTSELTKVLDLKNAIAKVLDMLPSALRLVSIEEGCVVVTFLIPATVASYVFDNGLTAEQEEKNRDLSVLWMKCGNYKLEEKKEGKIIQQSIEEVEKLVANPDEKAKLVDELKRPKTLCLMACGLAHTGKSALLDAISGGKYYHEHHSTHLHWATIQDESYKLILREIPNKDEYLIENCDDVDILLYCISLCDLKMEDNLANLKKLCAAFSEKALKNCIIVLTFADYLFDRIKTSNGGTPDENEYHRSIDQQKEKALETFRKAGINPDNIPIVETGHAKHEWPSTCEKPWQLNTLWKTVRDKSHLDGQAVLLYMRLNTNTSFANYNEESALGDYQHTLRDRLTSRFPSIAAAVDSVDAEGVANVEVTFAIGALAIGLPTDDVAAGVGLGLVLGGLIGEGSGVDVEAAGATTVAAEAV